MTTAADEAHDGGNGAAGAERTATANGDGERRRRRRGRRGGRRNRRGREGEAGVAAEWQTAEPELTSAVADFDGAHGRASPTRRVVHVARRRTRRTKSTAPRLRAREEPRAAARTVPQRTPLRSRRQPRCRAAAPALDRARACPACVLRQPTATRSPAPTVVPDRRWSRRVSSPAESEADRPRTRRRRWSKRALGTRTDA